MIYLFTGSDTGKVRAKAFAWVHSARTKAPEAPYLRLEAKEVTEETLAHITTSQGLFFSKTLALLDDPFSLSESGELVLESLETLAASVNPIAIVAPKLLAARLKKIENIASKVFLFDDSQKKAVRGFNSALVNALASKDVPLLWKELQKAQRQGEVPEALHGLLHWKARDMMQKGSSVWGKEGARKLSRDLIALLSDSRSGELPLSESLERFALSIRQ